MIAAWIFLLAAILYLTWPIYRLWHRRRKRRRQRRRRISEEHSNQLDPQTTITDNTDDDEAAWLPMVLHVMPVVFALLAVLLLAAKDFSPSTWMQPLLMLSLLWGASLIDLFFSSYHSISYPILFI
jgi:hypothetical protein